MRRAGSNRVYGFLIAVTWFGWGKMLRAELPVDPNNPNPAIASDTFTPNLRGETGRWELLPAITITTPTVLKLESDRYTTTYSDQFAGFPVMQISAARFMDRWGDFDWLLQATAGYGTRAGNYETEVDHAVRARDEMRLHFLPVSLSTRFNYNMPGFRLRPNLAIGVGANWLSQESKLPGFSSSSWVPFVIVTPGLTFLDTSAAGDWFGGFSFGASFFHGFASLQQLQGTNFELSLRILL